jgi:hypothetical protein
MHILGAEHNVPYHFGIGWNYNIQGILHATYGSERVYGSTYATNPAYIGPGIPGITSTEDFLEQPDHGTTAVCIFNFSIFYIGFDP